MSRDQWFETVAEAQRRAQKELPRSVYSALIAGSERGTTLEDNARLKAVDACTRAGVPALADDTGQVLPGESDEIEKPQTRESA